MTNHLAHYSRLMIFLHWFMLIQLIAVFAFIELREIFPKGSEPRELVKSLHYMLGLSVLFVAIIRIFVRLTNTIPAIIPVPGQLSQYLAKGMHFLLYVLIIAMPIAGWLMLSAAGKPIPFFGLELPALIGENEALADQIKDVHKTAGNLAYYLILAHALAGLYHHYFRRDNTLLRILPRR